MKEDMSKEQTPLTAWEFYENSDTANVYDVMEQYAQAKVLEALEREFTELGLMAEFYYHDDGLHYYETAVKPKYEK